MTNPGTNWIGALSVTFGATKATSFTVVSSTTITAFAPAEAVGTVDVTVTTPGGTSALVTKDRFNFLAIVSSVSPSSGSTAGGASVTVIGAGFGPGKTGTVLKFGTTAGTSVNCATSTECTVVSPAHAAGRVDVKATVSKLTSAKSAGDAFTYS